MTYVERFMVTEKHIKLLQHMFVGWQDCETGAPEINPKRPYGNSDVAEDVYEIIYGYYPEDGLTLADEEECMKLHRETEHALQIVLATGSFTPGTYVLTEQYNVRSWKLEEEN